MLVNCMSKDFPLNFRNYPEVSSIFSKLCRSYGQKTPWGLIQPPPPRLDRVKQAEEMLGKEINISQLKSIPVALLSLYVYSRTDWIRFFWFPEGFKVNRRLHMLLCHICDCVIFLELFSIVIEPTDLES